MKQLSYYPGCTLHTKAKSLDEVARRVALKLDIELVEMPAWTCCGAIYNTNTDDLASQLGPVRNLARASQLGDRLVTLCAACYNVLKRARVALEDEKDERTGRRLLDFIDEEYRPGLRVVHYLEVLRDDVGWEAIKARAGRSLDGLRVASYYGCLMSRPRAVMELGDATDPHVLDDLMAAIGAEPVPFDFKTKCCGGYLVVSRREVAENCSRRVVENAREAGAEVMTTSCPLCHYNIDALQSDIAAREKKFKPIPILYFPKLVGLALGMPAGELALDYGKIDPRPALRARGLIE
ncbi:MAG: CoB--CoM heterodisulfide reductase iron-sulfur subunit B family protein [bacterium]